MGKVVLLNDTYAWYHWGCTATSSAIRKRIRQLGFELISVPINSSYGFRSLPIRVDQFDDFAFFQQACVDNQELLGAISDGDVVVINGEGTMHHVSHASLALLYLAYAANKYMGKKVHMINHSVYPGDVLKPADRLAFQLYKGTYQHLDYIAIREHLSRELMQRVGVPSQLSFDCLPLTVKEDYRQRNGTPAKCIVVSGSVAFPLERTADLSAYLQAMMDDGYAIKVLVGAMAYPASDDGRFVESLRQQGEFGWHLVKAESLDGWLDCIASASVLVSGRFHHTIAAACLGTAVVAMASNTPKMRALTEILGIERPLSYKNHGFQDALLERTDRALAAGPVDPAVVEGLCERAERNFDGLRNLA